MSPTTSLPTTTSPCGTPSTTSIPSSLKPSTSPSMEPAKPPRWLHYDSALAHLSVDDPHSHVPSTSAPSNAPSITRSSMHPSLMPTSSSLSTPPFGANGAEGTRCWIEYDPIGGDCPVCRCGSVVHCFVGWSCVTVKNCVITVQSVKKV